MPVHRLSVLGVTSELPWPLDTGGHLRTFHLLRALASELDVRLVSTAPAAASGSALEAAGITVELAQTAKRHALREAWRICAAGVSGEPYVLFRRHDRGPVRAALKRAAAAHPPDVLYFDHLDSFVYSEVAGRALVVADFHNVYSLLAKRAAAEQSSPLRRLYLAREAGLLAKAERLSATRADLVMTVSSQEADYYAAAGARCVTIVPNGVDCARYASLPTGRSQGKRVIMYLGAMSWQPNAAAARFLAETVLPAVLRRVPDACLRIVGRDPLPEVLRLRERPHVEVTGRVDDVIPHLREAHVLAVPLEAGGGTRLKILEAFAAGLPVVSTPVGCEGIAAEHLQHLVIAPREQFADVISSLLAYPDAGARMAEAARALVREAYDWNAIGRTAVKAILAAHGARQWQPLSKSSVR